jgi:hypothetical protein
MKTGRDDRFDLNQPFDHLRSKAQALLRVDTERRFRPRPKSQDLAPSKYQSDIRSIDRIISPLLRIVWGTVSSYSIIAMVASASTS